MTLKTPVKLPDAILSSYNHDNDQCAGNEDSTEAVCVCGHAVEEHGNDLEYPGSSACSECTDCIAYEGWR